MWNSKLDWSNYWSHSDWSYCGHHWQVAWWEVDTLHYATAPFPNPCGSIELFPYFWQWTDVRLWTVWLDMDKTDGIMLVVTLRHLLSQIMFPPTQQPLCSCFVHCSPTLLELENDKNSSDNFQAQQQQMSVTYNSLSSPSHHHPHIVVPVTSLIVKLHPRLYRLHLPPVIAVKLWSRPATTHHCFSYRWIVWFLT